MSNTYWNTFYSSVSKKAPLKHPSQFAIFVYGETQDTNNMIEFGAGNGRDSFFFGTHGKKVLALDASDSAMNDNKDFADENMLSNSTKFQRFEVGKDDLEKIEHDGEKKFIYTRFFLHSLDDTLLKEFAFLCSKLLISGEQLFVEYRTKKDESRPKVFNDHYRNYINPENLKCMFEDRGLVSTYHVEGIGFAKYKDDDAYVARTIFKKT